MSDATNLILNADGSIYHLSLQPNEIGNTILLVGDPERVPIVSRHFDSVTTKKQHREICTHTGIYKGEIITCISTGMGTDNIDIVLNELDALANLDLRTGKPLDKKTQLTFIRIGTSGTLQSSIPVGSLLASHTAIGLDALGIYYQHKPLNIADELYDHLFKNNIPINPYAVEASDVLLSKLKAPFITGITASCPGFYAPQGRNLRAPKTYIQQHIIENLVSFHSNDGVITNLEMETSGIYLLAHTLGHHAISLNALLANRVTGEFAANPTKIVDELIELTFATFLQ
ncbi:MAG: nucleoside phosphorylase [Bacteroidetes bacterium]|nr:nucleoside phosphorylase [Bacteroidota bacterium]